MFNALKTFFRRSRKVYHPFNRDLARARVIIYHVNKYKQPVPEPHLTIAEYDGGEWAVCSVPFRDSVKEGFCFYLYNVVTCEIQETDAEFSLPRK